MTDQNTKLPSNQQAKWPDPSWSIPPYIVDTVHSISTLSVPAPATPGPFDWVLSSNGVKADIDFNFQTNQVLLNGSVSKAAILQTTTRASTAWADDINGNWSSFGSGIPRVTSKGYLYEGEARTNLTIWSSAITAGNWAVSNVVLTGAQSSPDGGASASLLAEDMSTTTKRIISTDSSSTFSYGATYTLSMFAKYTSSLRYVQIAAALAVAGSSSYATFDLMNGVVVAGSTSGGMASIITYPNGWYRIIFVFTATISANSVSFQAGPTDGSNTRIGVLSYLGTGRSALIWRPQAELNPNIDSSVASAAVHSLGGGSGYANGDTGTISGGTANTAATYTVTGQTAGVVTSVSVTAGDYTVFPPNSGSGVATASGGAQPGSGTGLRLDLTPTNQAALGYGVASSPILTTSAAVTRAADTNSPFSIVTGSGVTLYTKAIPLGTYTSSLQTACQMDDGSGSNRIIIDYIQALQQTTVVAAGSNVYSQLGSGWSAGVSSWIAVSSTAGTQLLSIDGITKTSGTGAQPIGMNSLRIGSYLSNLLPFMGYIQRVSVFSNTALPQLLLNGLQ